MTLMDPTMTANLNAEQIQRQLTGDIHACNALLSLLEEEQSALATKDADALANIIDQKLPALAQLENSAKQRAAWASANAPADVVASWDGVLDNINQKKLKTDWEHVKKLTLECKHKNEVNGKILARHQQVYGRLLELLRGQTAAPQLYNAYGAATQNSRSVKVDEA